MSVLAMSVEYFITKLLLTFIHAACRKTFYEAVTSPKLEVVVAIESWVPLALTFNPQQ